MITMGGLTETDRVAWENLFAGYNTFYGRTLAPDLVDRVAQVRRTCSPPPKPGATASAAP
jgi:hypothetical protein